MLIVSAIETILKSLILSELSDKQENILETVSITDFDSKLDKLIFAFLQFYKNV